MYKFMKTMSYDYRSLGDSLFRNDYEIFEDGIQLLKLRNVSESFVKDAVRTLNLGRVPKGLESCLGLFNAKV